MISYEQAQARRDRWMRWIFGSCIIIFLGGYFSADVIGWLPERISVRKRSLRHSASNIGERYDTFDPDLCLGIAIGNTRYRLNYATSHAIVTIPLFGVRVWDIPEFFEFQGQRFVVTALDPFAFLNAGGVEQITLPFTLQWLNQAHTLTCPELKQLNIRQADGQCQVFEPFNSSNIRPPTKPKDSLITP